MTLLILLSLISLTVVALIKVVGVVLLIALLTIPAVIARQWFADLKHIMLFASGLSAVCITTGLILSLELSSAYNLNIPGGPMVILVCSALYLISSAYQRSKHKLDLL